MSEIQEKELKTMTKSEIEKWQRKERIKSFIYFKVLRAGFIARKLYGIKLD